MESNAAEDGPVYLVEREEKLNSVECASVLVDEAFSKQLRNLRWDLIPVRLQQAILHAKISVLYWEKHLRIIVGSANITEQGYRRNQEFIAVLDLVETNSAEKNSILILLDYFLDLLSNSNQAMASINNRSIQFLERARLFALSFPEVGPSTSKQPFLSFPILTGPGRPNFLEQVNRIWQDQVGAVGPDDAYVISPFFDPPNKDNLPARKLWEILKKKGAASLSISTSGECSLDGKPHRVHAPASLLHSIPAGRKDLSLSVSIISEASASEKANRPLHAKGYWFSNGKRELYIIGSSNFTVRGLGLSHHPNLEANIGILLNSEKHPQLYNELNASWIKGQEVDTTTISWEPLVDDELLEAEQTASLPSFFQTATLRKDKELFIELAFDLSWPLTDFTITSNKDQLLLTYQDWLKLDSPAKVRVPIEEAHLPSYLLITWPATLLPASMPVNIENQACLPPPVELRNLPLDVLAELITSAKPVYAILKKYLANKAKHKADPAILIDPLKRFNASTFLLQRTRKYSTAINRIQTSLEKPFVTKASLEWRLYGPVGINATLDAMVRESNNASEAVFFLTEIWKSLGKVQPKQEKGCLEIAYVQNEVNKLREALGNRIIDLWPGCESMEINSYSKKILESI